MGKATRHCLVIDLELLVSTATRCENAYGLVYVHIC